jgi:saccharopine dehydrogenase-like NADP-dependent oxidoreductase
MKIVVIGGAGAMGRVVVQDLSESPEVTEILVADFNESMVREIVEKFRDKRIIGCFADARRVEELTKVIQGYDVVINCAQHDFNLEVMQACLNADCHYNDLGGMWHITKKQLKLFDDFQKVGKTAVCGIGAAPGVTNILARYAYDRLDEVREVRCAAALSEMGPECKDIFLPAYSIQTIMEEYDMDSYQWIDGQYRTTPAMTGQMEMVFPEPIGRKVCIHTLHSETATIPDSFKDKGIQTVTWRLSLPPGFEEKAHFLAWLGFASTEAVTVRGMQVVPREVLTKVVEKHLESKQPIKVPDIMGCLQVEVFGKKNGKEVQYTISSLCGTHSRWGVSNLTQSPAAIVAQMQVKGMIKEAGVWAPEKVIDPEYFLAELKKREMNTFVTIKEQPF